MKKINDTLGHTFGDNYIINAARIISESFSNIAKCYRVGGDEFVVVMKNASRFNVQQFLNSLEDRIVDFLYHKKALQITAVLFICLLYLMLICLVYFSFFHPLSYQHRITNMPL